jgi:glucuronoarabinoxylan endo-1,4-beta-xylanase
VGNTRFGGLILVSALLVWGCAPGSGTGPGAGAGGSSGSVGSGGSSGAAGASGTTGSAGTGTPGNAGTTGAAGTGTSGSGGSATGTGGAAGSGAAGSGGSGGSGGSAAGGMTGTAGSGAAGAAGGAQAGRGGAGGGGPAGMGGRGGGAAGAAGGAAGATGAVTVQLAMTKQTIQGFGINTALMPGDKTIPVDQLFTTTGTNAIGLSILRVGMNPNGTLTGKYVAEAKARGAKVIGSTWSPPANCKSNNSTVRGGNLLPSCYDSWSTTIANFAQQQGLYAMSIANETDFASCAATGPPCTDDYDTTVYTAKMMVDFVKVAGPKLRAVNVKVIAPEASEWIHVWSNISATGSLVASHPHSSDPLNCGCYGNVIGSETSCAQTCRDGNGYAYGRWLWNDQAAWNAFDILGVHEYDSQIAFAWPADINGGRPNKEVWQTEMSGVRHWPEEGPSITIQNGVAVAGWIHSALTVGEASAWLYWWYEAYYQNDNEGLALIQGNTTIAKRYFTMGNYSKFVRPGYVAVDVTGNSNANVLISAYKGTDGTVVVVAINKGTAAVTVPISITGGTAPASMTPNVTSASQNLVAGTAVPVSGGSFMAALAGTTVTTFVGR